MKTESNNTLETKAMPYDAMLSILRPQERDYNGEKVTFVFKTGEKLVYPKAYSVPMKRCEGCPIYIIDERTTPTAYYCQSQFVSSYVFLKAVKNKKVPESCKMWHTESVRKYAR